MLNKERKTKKKKRRSRSPSHDFEIVFSQFEIRFNQVDSGGQIVQTKFIDLNFINKYCKIRASILKLFFSLKIDILIPFEYISI